VVLSLKRERGETAETTVTRFSDFIQLPPGETAELTCFFPDF